MPAKSAVLFLDSVGQMAKIFHRHHDGGWTHETVQDVQPFLDANREAQNHCNPNSPSGDLRMVARIPPIFAQKWFDEEGLDIWSADPDVQRAIDQKLNSDEYRWLRTDNSVL